MTETERNIDSDLYVARRRFQEVQTFESDNRDAAVEDMRFFNGEGQWDALAMVDRAEEGRPVLTLNQLPAFLEQVVGEQRRMRYSYQISASGADTGSANSAKNARKQYTMAQVFEGIIRRIEAESTAWRAYNHAFEQMLQGGFPGYWRILNVYEHARSLDQVLRIRKIFNPFTVHMDPRALLLGPKDAEYCFVSEVLPKSEFQERWRDARSDFDSSAGESMEGWHLEDGLRVAEYYRIKRVKEHLVYLSDGRVLQAKDIAGREMALNIGGRDGPTVIGERKNAERRKVVWSRLSAFEELEGPIEYEFSLIPVVPCYGRVNNLEGKAVLRGLFRHAKDAQRMLNYWESAKTEVIALQPKAPYLAADKQIEGYEDMWENANRKNYSYLPYRHVDGAPPPQRQAYGVDIRAMVEQTMLSREYLKSTLGMYDAFIGNKSNETSGVAIQQRKLEGETGQFSFIDNFADALEYSAQVLIDMIPHIYDNERVMRLKLADDSEDWITVNQRLVDGFGQVVGRAVNLAAGSYDVTVTVGPSASSQRAEAAASLEAFMKVVAPMHPQAVLAVADLYAANQDWPVAQEIARRLRKLVPPNLLYEEKEGEEFNVEEFVAQAVQQATGQLQEELQRLQQQIIETREQAMRNEFQYREERLRHAETKAKQATQEAARALDRDDGDDGRMMFDRGTV
jgi:hypothetical protein